MVDGIAENQEIYIHNSDDLTEIAVKRKLAAGQIYSSWNEVYTLIGCELLGQKTLKGGKQKNNAKKYLLQYADFVFVEGKRTLLCTEIYTVPRYDESLTQDNRGKNGVYIDRMIPVYIDYLLKQDRNEWFTFPTDIAKIVGLVGANYKVDRIEDMKKINPVFSAYMVNECYSHCREHLEREVYLLLDRLQKNYNMLEYKKNFRIVTAEGTHISDSEEEKIINETEKEVLAEMQMESKKIIFWKNLIEKFYSRVYEIVNEKYNFTWRRYYRQIQIRINRDELIRIADRLSRDTQSIGILREELRVLSATKIYNQIISKYNNRRKKAAIESAQIEMECTRRAKEQLKKEQQEDSGEKTTIWDMVQLGIFTKEEAIEKMVKAQKKPFNYHESFLVTQYELVTYLVAKPDIPYSEEQEICA